MPEVLASALPEKPVLSSDGRELGTVYSLTMEPQTGTLRSVVVDPDPGTPDIESVETTEAGRFRLPATAVTGVDDHLVVDLG